MKILKVVIVALLLIVITPTALASPTLYVCVSDMLNAREEPNLKAEVQMRLYPDDEVIPLSVQNGWVEIEGGESGTSWCKAEHLSEIKEPKKYTNTSGGKVWIRKPLMDMSNKARKGEVKANKTITVTRVVFGWGYIKDKGWVDLSFFEEEGELND